MATVVLDAGEWLRWQYERDIPQFAPWETHVTQTGAEGAKDGSNGAEIQIDTEANRYAIRAEVKGDGSTYLGCVAKSRKFRPGEDWHRGNDLPDGPMTEQTWRAILGAILGYEIQRSQRKESIDPSVLTVYETEPDGISVLWDRATGGVKVSPDGEWLMPSTWQGRDILTPEEDHAAQIANDQNA